MMKKKYADISVRRDQRGAALLFALGALALFMLLALAFVAESLTDRKIAANRAAKPMAAVLCESAINHIRALLIHYQVDPATLSDIDSLEDFRSVGNEAAGDPLAKTLVDMDDFLDGTDRDWSNVFLAPSDTYWKYIKTVEPTTVDDSGNVSTNDIITGRYAFTVLNDYSGRYPELTDDTNTPVNWGTHEEYLLLGAPGVIFSQAVRDALADDEDYKDIVYKHLNPIPSVYVDGFMPSSWGSGYVSSGSNPVMADIWQRFNLARNDWDSISVDELLDVDNDAMENRVYGSEWDKDFEDSSDQMNINKTKSIAALPLVADDPATFADLATRRKQIAANLIDYSDSDSRPRSDVAPADWSADNKPSYTGNEKTRYIDRLGFAVNPDITVSLSGSDISLKCNIEKALMAGLVDMYDLGIDDNADYEAVVEFDVPVYNPPDMVHITMEDFAVYYCFSYEYRPSIFSSQWLSANVGSPEEPLEYVPSAVGSFLLNVDWGDNCPASVTIPFAQIESGTGYYAAVAAGKETYEPLIPIGTLLNAVVYSEITQAGHLLSHRNIEIKLVGVKARFNVEIEVPVESITLKRNGENVDFANLDGMMFEGVGQIVFDYTDPDNSYQQALPFISAFYTCDPRQNLNPGDWWQDGAYFAAALNGNFPYDQAGYYFGFDNNALFQNAADNFTGGLGSPAGNAIDAVYSFSEIDPVRNPLNAHTARDVNRDMEPGSDPAALSTARIADRPMRHLYELGYIHRGAKWETLNISRVPDFADEDAVNASRFSAAASDGLSYAEGDGWLLDCVTVRPMDDDDLRPDNDEEYFTSEKFFDVNAVSDDSEAYSAASPGDRYFRRIFADTDEMDDVYEVVKSRNDTSGTPETNPDYNDDGLVDDDYDRIAGIMNHNDKPRFINRSEVLADFDGHDGLLKAAALALEKKISEDKVAADIAMRTVADIDSAPEQMRVLIVAQSIRDLGGDEGTAITVDGVSALRGRFDEGADEISGEQRAIVTLCKDAFSGKYIVSKVEYLEEYY